MCNYKFLMLLLGLAACGRAHPIDPDGELVDLGLPAGTSLVAAELDAERTFVAWQARRYEVEGARGEVRAAVLEGGGVTLLADAVESSDAWLDLRVAVAGPSHDRRGVVAWHAAEHVELVIYAPSGVRRASVPSDASRRELAMGASADRIVLVLLSSDGTRVLPERVVLDLDGAELSRDRLGAWTETDQLDSDAAGIAVAPDGRHVVSWVRRREVGGSWQRTLEAHAFDASGAALGAPFRQAADNARIGVAMAGETSVAVMTLRWDEASIGVAELDRVGSLELARVEGLGFGHTPVLGRGSIAYVVAEHDPDWAGCTAPPLLWSELRVRTFGDSAPLDLPVVRVEGPTPIAALALAGRSLLFSVEGTLHRFEVDR